MLDNPRTSAAAAATPASGPSNPRGRGRLARSLLAVLLPLTVLPLLLFAILVYLHIDFNTAIVIAVVTLVISLLGVIFVVRRVTVPLQSLTEAAAAMAGGDLAPANLASRSDELGQLADAYNRMSAELRGVYENLDSRVEARTQQLATAAEIGRAATSILTAEDLLARSAELIRERFGFDHVLIFLVDDNARSVLLTEAAGSAAAQLKARGLRYTLDSSSLIGWVASNRQPHAARRVSRRMP